MRHAHLTNLALMFALLMLGLLGLVGLFVIAPPLALGAVIIALGGGAISARWLWRVARLTPTSGGLERLRDREALVTVALAPEGRVRVGGEDWAARLDDPFAAQSVPAGRLVRVVGLTDLTLLVAPTVAELLDHARAHLLIDPAARPPER